MSEQRPDLAAGRSTTGPTTEQLRRSVPALAGGKEVVVGIFVLIGVVSAFLVLFLMTDPATFRGRYVVATEVEEAGGIRRGDPVQMRGVNIGRVQDFELTQEGVLVTLEINGEWEIPVDSNTRLVSQGLLGGRTVEVIPGDSPERASRGDVLPGETMEDFFHTAEQLGGQAREIMGRVQEALSPEATRAVETSARELETLLASLSRLARQQEGEIATLTRRLNEAAAHLGDAAESAGPDLARAASQADSTLQGLRRTSETLDEAVGSLRSILGRVDAGEGTLGQLSHDPALYGNLTQAAESLYLLMEDIRANPSRYLNLRIF